MSEFDDWIEDDEDDDDDGHDWQICPACGRRFDAADDTGLGFGGCPEGNCVACERCCKCLEGAAGGAVEERRG